MKVFKFGGASIKDADAIRNVCKIIGSYDQERLMLVISAAGKTTNALEGVVNAFYHQTGDAKALLGEIRIAHHKIIDDLFEKNGEATKEKLEKYFHHVEEILIQPSDYYDFVYDQIVSLGELLSTNIVSDYLNRRDCENQWIDARQYIRTDNTYREARINWELTTKRIDEQVKPILQEQHVLTQGFIGGTPENFTTTLGREGSDFTASIFAYALDAEGVYIWKDVPGVLNADPRQFKSVSKLDFLSYRDAIEMTYYGAQVIHPKTIKPLQNKGIPLYVRSFINPEKEGTQIKADLEYSFIPPVIVLKPNQVMLNIATKDFSFIAEENLSFIYSKFATHRIKVNMMQNSAVSFTVCFDNDHHKLQGLLQDLEKDYFLEKSEGLRLITVKHYNESVMAELKAGTETILEERQKNTVQLLVKDV